MNVTSAPPEMKPAAPSTQPGLSGAIGTSLAVALVAAAFLPVGVANLLWLVVLVLAGGFAVRRGMGWLRPLPHEYILLLFLALLCASSLWTEADQRLAWSHTGHYAQLLLLMLLPRLMPTPLAQRALRYFALAAIGVAGMYMAHGVGVLPDTALTTHIVFYKGNKSISLALMLTLGAGLCIHLALGRPRLGWPWLAGTALIMAALAWQSPNRTALLLLPVLCVATVLFRLRSLRASVLSATAVLVVAIIAYFASPLLRDRFGEGLQSVTRYDTEEGRNTSWGARALMIRETLGMVTERPLLGHGAGAWLKKWQERVTDEELRNYVTPHNEPLLIASQVGLVGLGLFLVYWLALVRRAWQAGPMRGTPALTMLAGVALASLANVVLRDSVFALPLLFTLGLALAAANNTPTEAVPPQG
jgi:O-antigen ligase